MLIGYLPTTKLEMIENKSAHWCTLVNLFHFCVRCILGPISSYGKTGIAMLSGDGVWHCCHPILACFISDYPEQALVTCTYFGCGPKCQVLPVSSVNTSTFQLRITIRPLMCIFWQMGMCICFPQHVLSRTWSWCSTHFGSLYLWWTSFYRLLPMCFISFFKVSWSISSIG